MSCAIGSEPRMSSDRGSVRVAVPSALADAGFAAGSEPFRRRRGWWRGMSMSARAQPAQMPLPLLRGEPAHRQALLERHRQGLSQRHAMLTGIPGHVADLESRDRKARRQRRSHIRQYRHKQAVSTPSAPRPGSDTEFSAERRRFGRKFTRTSKPSPEQDKPVSVAQIRRQRPALSLATFSSTERYIPFSPFLVSDLDRPFCHP